LDSLILQEENLNTPIILQRFKITSHSWNSRLQQPLGFGLWNSSNVGFQEEGFEMTVNIQNG
jgi:hypothetical protein